MEGWERREGGRERGKEGGKREREILLGGRPTFFELRASKVEIESYIAARGRVFTSLSLETRISKPPLSIHTKHSNLYSSLAPKNELKLNPPPSPPPPFSQDSDPLLPLLPQNLNRYPSPTHNDIKSRLATLRNLPGPEYVFLGVGSDEVIDLVMRVVCTPGKDKVMVTPPTYGMYSVTAQVNDVEVVKCPLDVEGGRFGVEVEKVSRRFFFPF